MELEFRTSAYCLVVEQESGKISAYANFSNAPNLSALPKECWLNWIHFHFGLTNVTYGNALFLTFLVVDDPYNNDILHDIFKELFLREPKIKFICTVAPPIDSIYEDILSIHGKQIFSLDRSISKLSQSIFFCEKYDIIPRMRLRRALIEDNDDLVEIIDEKFKAIRLELGNYYIAEQVMRNDPSETIIVAEILNTTIGMIWVNANIHRKTLADSFEIAAYGNFLKPHQQNSNVKKSRNVIDLIRKRSEDFFDKTQLDGQKSNQKIFSDEPLSLNNLYVQTSSSDSNDASDENEDEFPKELFKKWQQISKTLRSAHTYTEEVQKQVAIPNTTEDTSAFAIQIFGLSSSIDARRVFDLVAASFCAYPEKDYCIISLSSAEASSDSLSGPLLRYFSVLHLELNYSPNIVLTILPQRVIPRVGCKISDCLYVAHRNSFLAEIELSELTSQDVADVENILCHSAFRGQGIYNVADISQTIVDYLTNPCSDFNMLTIRCRSVIIGFVLLRQNCTMCEFQTNYILYDDDDLLPEWKSGELKYIHLHPAFAWEWVHVAREIFRLTGYISLFYKLRRESNQPVLNSILLNMFPIFPRKRIYGMSIDPYALYYLNIKMCHLLRVQIENKIVIVGFNETCKGFLRTLLFSPKAKRIQCLNITVVTDCPGFIEAEHDIKYFEKQHSMFFQAKNQFTADYLRKLEFRTWVRFIGGELKAINGSAKRIVLENNTVLRYDRLFLMCSSRYSAPKSLKVVPSNYLEINSRLDKIMFYHKVQLLRKEYMDFSLPILIYGTVVMAHSCVSALLEMDIKPSQICLVVPADQKIDFPETIDDEYVTNWLYTMESRAGVKIYKNLKFLDWQLYPNVEAIESVIFEIDSENISLKCLAFISFHGKAFSERLQQTLKSEVEILNNRIIIDEHSKTNIPYVYACGRITQYHKTLLANNRQQRYLNQIEVGNQLAMNFIEGRLTGLESNVLNVHFVKPIFRQSQLMDGWLYGGLRSPGRYISRQMRKGRQSYGLDLITHNENGEYCRLSLDQSGFVSEIMCLTKKYQNLEILYRIYGLHESYFNSLKAKCECGEIKNLLDFFHQESFVAILHDQFALLRQTIRKKNLDCLKELNCDQKSEIDKMEIQTILKSKKMDESMQNDLMEFIKKHWKSLHPHYALPNDFSQS